MNGEHSGSGGRGGGHGAGDLYETGELGQAKANIRPGWVLLALLALIGLVVGAWATTEGTEDIIENFAISGTVFGATIATVVLSLEDIFPTAEPARRDRGRTRWTLSTRRTRRGPGARKEAAG